MVGNVVVMPMGLVSSTVIVVGRLDAMKNMWESLGEPLGRDLKNI